MNDQAIEQASPNSGFKEYESKPITRLAYEVPFGQHIEKTGEATFRIAVEGKDIEFKAYEPVKAGDYIVYLNDNDVYHCSRTVFHERNIV